VKFRLKPPPKPVLLPSRPKKRRPAPEAEEDDLGLSALGIELPDLEGMTETGAEELPAIADAGEIPGVEGEKADALPPEGEDHGALPAAVEEEPEDEAEEDREEAPSRPVRAAAKGKPKKPAPAPQQAAAPKKPAPSKAHPKKAAAKKPAAKKASRPAPKREGKKK
jgi:hypothetical protein